MGIEDKVIDKRLQEIVTMTLSPSDIVEGGVSSHITELEPVTREKIASVALDGAQRAALLHEIPTKVASLHAADLSETVIIHLEMLLPDNNQVEVVEKIVAAMPITDHPLFEHSEQTHFSLSDFDARLFNNNRISNSVKNSRLTILEKEIINAKKN
jgi:hypothetical protein